MMVPIDPVSMEPMTGSYSPMRSPPSMPIAASRRPTDTGSDGDVQSVFVI